MSDQKKDPGEGGQTVHMCTLKEQGIMDEIDRRCVRPRVVCAKCGVKADDAAYVCNPRRKEEQRAPEELSTGH